MVVQNVNKYKEAKGVMKRKIKKEVRQLIREAQIRGETNKDIYNYLVKEYRDKKTIAELIVTTVKPKDKKKQHLYISIQLAFTAIILLFNVWLIHQSTDLSFIYFWDSLYLRSSITHLIIPIVVLIFVIPFKENVRNRPFTFYGYWMYIFSCLMIYILFYTGILMGKYWLYVGIDLFLIFFTIFLARFFQRKIFPDYRYRKLKQDDEGEYIFS